jgi:pilus assembly protein FimV
MKKLTAGEPGMFRKSAVVLALLLLSLSYRLYALGLGEIEMHSALNQPMSADISLISATGVDLSEVKIALASRASHERLGLSRTKILSDFSFAITEDSRGRPFIHISSTELVHEPYLEFLIEMVWQNGQMVREYTVLVDPPVTMQARPAVPVAPVARAPQPAPVIAEPVRQAWPAPAPRPVRPAYIPAPVEKQAVQHYGQVRRDDTLWSLAKNLRPSTDIGIEQMMIALQTANPDAFGDNNINNLHAGVTLKVPDRDAILALSKRQARAEARRQNREWNDKRNAANAVTKQPVAEMPVREEEMPVQQDGAVVETEAQLKLTPPEGEMVAGSASGSEAGDTDSGASGDGNIRQQLVLASEEIEAGRAESEELQSRVQELEGQVQNMQRLLELKSEELAGIQNEPGEQVAEAVVSEEMPAGEEQQSAEEAEVEAELAAAEDSPVTEPRSIVDRLMDNPVLAGLGVLIAMLLGGFLWGSMRKHRSQELFDDEMTLDKHLTKAGGDVASSTGLNISDPGEFDEGSPDEMESHASDDVNDPVTEADVYLAYGRIQQAEDVLQAALQDDPENVAIHSKLLRVYHAAGNATAFNSAAGEFRELVGDDDGQWQRIAALGNELSPGNELYRPETETLAEQDNVVEFDMDLSEPGDASPQAGEIAEADAAVQELDMAMGTETVDDAVQELEMATETDETEILPESIEFTLDDEDEYENEAEGLLASADEVATKLDLARAYLDMEDPDGARSILQEVIDEGDEEQKSEAQSLISKIA